MGDKVAGARTVVFAQSPEFVFGQDAEISKGSESAAPVVTQFRPELSYRPKYLGLFGPKVLKENPNVLTATVDRVDVDGDGASDDGFSCVAERAPFFRGDRTVWGNALKCEGITNVGQDDEATFSLLRYQAVQSNPVAVALAFYDREGSDGLSDLVVLLHPDTPVRLPRGDKPGQYREGSLAKLVSAGIAVFPNQTTVRTEEVAEEPRPQASASPVPGS